MSLLKVPGFALDSTSNFTFANATVTSNLVSGNANLGNVVIANYFVGNGSLLTGLPASYSNTNVAAYLPTYTGNLTSGNANLGNLVVANYHSGNGYLLSGITGANVTGQVGNALIAGTVYTNAQPNITSVGTLTSLSVTGNVSASYFIGNGSQLTGLPASYSNTNVAAYLPTYAGALSATDTTITGNLTVSGNFEYVNSTILRIEDPVIEQGGGPNATALSSNDGMDRGQLLHYYTTTPVDAFMGWKNSAGEFVFASNASLANNVATINTYGNIHTGNANLGNLVTANYYTGNGYLLSGITGANVTGTVATANNASYLGGTAAASYLLTTGTGSSLTAPNGANVTGTVSYANNANYLGGTAASGYLLITGTGSSLTAPNGANVTGTVANANYALYAGTVTTNAQPNITSLGNLTSANITGNLTVGNISGANAISANYFVGNGSLLTGLPASYSNTNVAAYLPTYTGNFSAGNISVTTTANVSNLVVTSNANLGAVGNVHISGGSSGYVLSTDGSGSLSWVAQSGSGGGSVTPSQYITKYDLGTNQSLTNNTDNTVHFDTSVYDPQSWFNTGTYQFKPTIAGYYKITFGAWFTTGSNGTGQQFNVQIRKNGSGLTIVQQPELGNVGQGLIATDTIYLNGGSDYLTFTAYASTGTISLTSGNGTYFEAFLIGSASATSNIGNGNSNINVASANANVTVSVNNTSNIAVFANTGVTINGNITTSANSNINVGGELVVNNYNQHGGAGYAGIITMTNSGGGSNPNKFLRLNSTGSIEIINSGYSATIFTLTDSGNLTVPGNVSASNYIGNGSALSSLTGANVTGQVSNSLVAGTVYTNAQPNITSVGTLTSLTVTGNISSGNANLGNLVTSNYFTGNGSLLTSLTGANVIGTVANATYAASAGSATTSGTVTTNAQPNITSVGTLTSLTVTANITSGNANLGNLVYANYHQGDGSLLTNITGANVTGTVATANNASYLGGTAAASYLLTTGTGSLLTAPNGANVTGTVANSNYSIFAGTVLTNAQPNITSVGTLTGLTVSGNTTITGNLSVTGSLEYINSNAIYLQDPVIQQGGGANGAALSTNDGYDRGTLLHYYTTSTVDAFMGWKNSAGEFVFASNASLANNVATINTYGNIHTGNANLGNLATSNYFTGNGYLLAGITGANVTGQVANALLAGTVYTNAQPNITSVGSLTNLTLAANGNITLSGSLSQVTGANLLSGTYLAGTLTTAAQPNITSLGNLTSANVAGNLIVGNVSGANAISANYFVGNGSLLTGLPASYSNANVASYLPTYTGNITAGNITTTSLETVGNLTTTGNVSAGNLLTNNILYANGVAWSFSNSSGNANYANFAGTVLTSAQPNITSVGTLTSLTVSGLVTATGTGIKVANIQDTTGTITIATNYGSKAGDVGIYGNLTVGTSGTGNTTTSGLTATGNVTFTSSPNVSLGAVGNVKITGGTTGQYLKTDGTGNLSWATVSGGSGSGITYTANVTPPGTANIADQWFNTSTNTLYEYINDGVANYWVDIQTPTVSSSSTNVTIAGFVSRTYTGDGSTVNFTISSNLSAASVIVTENGVVQVPTTDYTVSGTTLTFISAPLTGVVIQIRELAYATPQVNNLTATGNVAVSNLTISGTANLGPIGNVKITGGTSGQLISTDGTGNLSFITPVSSNARIVGYNLVFGM